MPYSLTVKERVYHCSALQKGNQIPHRCMYDDLEYLIHIVIMTICFLGESGLQHQGGTSSAATESVCRHRTRCRGGARRRGGRITGNRNSPLVDSFSVEGRLF